MAKKTEKNSNGRFPEPEKPGSSIFWWGLLTVIFSETIIFAIPCGYMCVKNIYKRVLATRFERYRRILGYRTGISVRELAKAENRTEDAIRRDLNKMIDMGWFGPNAFLNHGEGTLIVPLEDEQTSPKKWASVIREVFDQMKKEENAAHESEAKETAAAKQTEKAVRTETPATPKEPPRTTGKTVRETYIENLERTLNELYELNRQIEDEAVSARIDRIGTLTAGIFRVVIENPGREADVRRFMNYYLPTTLKLLKTYDLLEDDHVQSESIQQSRRKIENILDRLIEAFEQLHSQLYSTDTLDIDTDIEVLETMMAKDGLSDKGRIQMPSH